MNVIKYAEDDVDEISGSYFSKANTILFDKIDNGKDGVLPSSKFVDLIETLREDFHSKDLAGYLRKVDQNESGSLDHFSFVMCYVELFEGPDGNKLEEEVSLEST